jgi:hypothetical protein
MHRRALIDATIAERGVTKQEIDLAVKSKNKGKFKLGFGLLDNSLDKIESVYIKYHDLTKRKLY